MDRTYFATVESGKRNISLQNIEKIANGLNITISELFEGIGGNCNDYVNWMMTDDSGVESKNNAMTLWINTCCLP